MEQDDHDDRRSPRGKRVGLLLDEVNKIEAEEVAQVAILLSTHLQGVAVSFLDTNCYLQHNVWSTFHRFRESGDEANLGVFVSTHLCRQESELALQLPLDRVLKKLLHNKADCKETKHCKLTRGICPAMWQ